MAFGFRCKQCGCQETEHEYAECGACKKYQSPDKNAENQLWEEDAKEKAQYENRNRRGWAYDT